MLYNSSNLLSDVILNVLWGKFLKFKEYGTIIKYERLSATSKHEQESALRIRFVSALSAFKTSIVRMIDQLWIR